MVEFDVIGLFDACQFCLQIWEKTIDCLLFDGLSEFLV